MNTYEKHGGRGVAIRLSRMLSCATQEHYPGLHMNRADQPHVFPARIHKVWIMRCVDVPRDVSTALRSVAGENALHIPVHGWIEGLPMKSTLVPRGGGCYRLHVHSRIWRKLRIDAGATVEVTLLLDAEPREVVLPQDFAAGLADEPRALATFNTLTTALRRQIVQYVDSAKHARTREKRIQLVVRRMHERAAKRKKKKNKRAASTSP
jgi:Bacteriocin-protection, YdeI or OmpD-Associated/Domain of unknown function (DUF1905)